MQYMWTSFLSATCTETIDTFMSCTKQEYHSNDCAYRLRKLVTNGELNLAAKPKAKANSPKPSEAEKKDG